VTQRHVAITGCLLIAGGAENLIGFYLFNSVFQVVLTGGLRFTGLGPVFYTFLSGMIGFGLVMPFIVPKAISIFERNVGWPRWGASWGAVVGLLGSQVYGVIQLIVVPFNMIPWGVGVFSAVFELKDVPYYLLFVSIYPGIPSALVGTVVGGASEIVGRRFFSERKNGAG
jgi:hypothetical protein